MEVSDELTELLKALTKVQGIIAGAKKDTENKFFKNKYADLASVWEVIREPLSENGLCVIQSPENCEQGIKLVTRLYHTSGQCVSSILEIPVDKNDAQGIGKAIAYARRYALSAIVGVYSEDDDGQSSAPEKVDLKQKLKPTCEWMTKLQNIKKDPNFKSAIKALAKEKKFKNGSSENEAQFNFELITSYEPPKVDENEDEFF